MLDASLEQRSGCFDRSRNSLPIHRLAPESVIAGAAMALSSVSVISNALRLNGLSLGFARQDLRSIGQFLVSREAVTCYDYNELKVMSADYPTGF